MAEVPLLLSDYGNLLAAGRENPCPASGKIAAAIGRAWGKEFRFRVDSFRALAAGALIVAAPGFLGTGAAPNARKTVQ